METSIPNRISKLKKLAKEYLGLPDKMFIERHDELLRICDVRGSVHEAHPHKAHRIYISRRALKHFVEHRREELSKNHTSEATLSSIYFALEKLPEAIIDFDQYTYEPPRHFYTKEYSHLGKPSLRILLEKKKNTLEIYSIHFRKHRKT